MLLTAAVMGAPLVVAESIDPEDAFGIWDFNNASQSSSSADLIYGTPMVFQEATAFSSDAGGRSGSTGDRALNFGIGGGNYATVATPGFLALVNQSNQESDRLSVVFWLKWSTNPVTNSAVWFSSAGASGEQRGFQGHVPWSGNDIYFDTSGCCDAGVHRLNGSVSGVSWQQWNHIALIKNGGAKQVWINGELKLSQASGAAPLRDDWTDLVVGTQPGTSNSVRGLIDDLAVFGTALDAAQLAALTAGATPDSLVIPPAQRPPAFADQVPSDRSAFYPTTGNVSFSVSTVSPNTLPAGNIHLFINGVDESANLQITGSATQRTANYIGALQPGRFYSLRAEASDDSGRESTNTWSFDTADPAVTPNHGSLDFPDLGATTRQSTTAGSATAALAIDSDTTSIAETANVAGSFWELELERTLSISRVYVTAPAGPNHAGVLDGAVVRLYGLRDQLIHEVTIDSIAPGGVWAAFLPPGIEARIVRVELPAGQTNGAGDYRIALAELELLGDPSPAFGPLDLASIGSVSQSTTNGANHAALAIDADASTRSETTNGTNSYWLLKLDRARPLSRIEIINAATSPARLGGLTLRLLDDHSVTLATTTLTNPGASATWAYNIPSGTANACYLRIGLENGATNGNGDRVVALAGVSVFCGTNCALNTPAYMVRLLDNLPSPALANDGNYATHTETTTQTTDGYWETDLVTARALYSVRVVAYDSGADQARLTHATLRLYDENHQSIYSKHLSGTSANFDIALPGPVTARYVRVGFENKERSSANGGIEWYLRLREVQAFGRPLDEIGIAGFTATPDAVNAGQGATLGWQVEGLREVILHPLVGSAGSQVSSLGTGSLVVNPTTTTEYTLVGYDQASPVLRHITVVVDGRQLPPRISEFCADNQLSLRDGFGDPSDWIELRNPNNSPLDVGGYGLSDDPADPMKWRIPVGTTIPAHGTLVIIASGRDSGPDDNGYLHTNFSLKAGGESLLLTRPDGITLADAFLNFPPQGPDLSYGRDADGMLAFLTPTPGAFNLGTPLAGWLMPPLFSHSRGFQAQPFSLVLTNPNPDGTLYYSIDGTEPSLTYSGPLAINGSTSVRATVRRGGYQTPRVQTHSYLFQESVMSSPLMNPTYTQGPLANRLRDSLTELPSICLSVPEIPDDRIEREASIEVFMPDGSAPFQINAGMVRTGGSWTDFAKRSYRLSFRASYGARNLDLPLFGGFDHGIPAKDSIDTLDLTAGNHDMVDRGFYMANRFVEDTMLEMGSLNPHGRFVHVYLNGVYWGQYNAHERLEDSFLSAYLGGSNSDYVNIRGNDNAGNNFVTGTPEPPNREPWEFVRANRFSYTKIKDRVDLAQLIDFMLVWYYGDCESEFRCAGPIAPGSGFKFWAADADGFLRTSALTLDNTANPGPGGIFGALVAEGHPDFKILLADRIHRHFFNEGALTPERNLARFNTRMIEVQDSMIAESARWGYRTPGNWLAAAETIRTGLFPQRTENLLGYLENRGLYPAIDAPVLSRFGGSVPQGYPLTFSSGAGTIYYTTDGSDPRLPGGAIAPGALAINSASQLLIPVTSEWKYWDRGSLPAANWQSSAYSDAAWSSGAAPLGYGGGESTTISYGPNASEKPITSYFRKTFVVADPSAVTALTASLARDDGAVVYLNGVEVARSNMPATGAIGFNTLASTAVGGTAGFTFQTLTLPAGLLVAGNNLLAVEVHQISPTSSDVHFKLTLSTASSPSIAINQNSQIKARFRSGSRWSALADASFHVAHPLIADGPYVFNEWPADAGAGTSPSAIRFYQTDQVDPALGVPMDLPWTLAYDLTSRSRINGLGADGIAFVNTGNVQTTPGAGYVGAAVLALDCSGAQDIRVAWTGGTVAPNERDYGIRLQYRVGSEGPFIGLTTPSGLPVEYLRNSVAGHSQVIAPVTLPSIAENQPLVELRWRYHFRGSGSGSRAHLRLDDIQVTAGPVVPETLAFLQTPLTAQAGAIASAVAVELRGRNGALATGYSGMVTLTTSAGPGSVEGTLSREAHEGVVWFEDLVFPNPGTFYLTASGSGLTDAMAILPTRVAGLTEVVMPRFIQGATPVNNERVPFACLLQVEGLLPNSSYRYAQQFVDSDDSPTQEGAGNMLLTGSPFVRCTSSPSFLAEDLNLRHGEFTTDADGKHSAWFPLEPTGNVRFTPGAEGRIRLLLNDGDGGESVAFYLTAPSSVRVLQFGTAADQGSAVFGESAAAPRRFLVFYDDAAGLTRPLAAAPVEATGIAAYSGQAPFYQANVSGQVGRWGTILPNGPGNGIRRVEERDGAGGSLISVWMPPDGITPGSGLAGGADAIGLRIPAVGDSPFVHWLAARFALADLNDPATGGPYGDGDRDGVVNLLEFAFGLDPLASSHAGLPELLPDAGNGLRFRYRRLLAGHGLDYRIEHSAGLDDWADAEPFWNGPEQVVADPNGLTETVTRFLNPTVVTGDEFFRVKVSD